MMQVITRDLGYREKDGKRLIRTEVWRGDELISVSFWGDA